MEKVKKGKFCFEGPEWNKVSDNAKSLITKMLCYNPKDRYSAQ